MAWFEGFEGGLHAAGDVELFARTGGDPAKPPLLLLHGYPQTHAMWHRVARLLAADFSLVIPDLRGYGDSAKPGPAATPEADHALHSKRAMAADMAALMRGARPRALLRRRPRPRRPGGAPAGARPCRSGRAAGADRHRADARHVRARRHARRDRLLPLVLPDPAGAAARAA